MRAASTPCTVGGSCRAARALLVTGAARCIPPAGCAAQHPLVHQGLDDFLHEEGIALRFRQNKLLEGLQGRVAPQQRREQRVRLLWPQRIEPQLGVIGFAAPGVLVLGPVIHQQQEARCGDPLAEEVSARPASRCPASAGLPPAGARAGSGSRAAAGA